jgi:hypothetical protein
MEDLPREKPDFLGVCTLYRIYYDDLLHIAEQAGVTREVLQKMFLSVPVKRAQAESVLKAFSHHIGRSWTMENTRVPTFPESEEDKP